MPRRKQTGGPKLLESQIQRAVIDVLILKGWLVVKVNNVGIRKENGSFIPPRELGISDLICCTPNGRMVCCEIKTQTGVLSEHQIAWLTRAEKKGALCYVIRSVDEAIGLAEHMKRYGIPSRGENWEPMVMVKDRKLSTG